MKVLILTGRFGMGHVSVAKSLEEQILGDYKDISVEIVDLMEYTAPRAAGFIYGAFAFLARHGRSLYNFIYKQAGKRDESEWTAFTVFSMHKLTTLLEEKKPDVVISTLPLCSLLVSKYKERMVKKAAGGRVPSMTLATCITDISSHSEWLQPNTDFYLVGDELVKRQLVNKGVEGDSVVVTGIPVRRAFSEDLGFDRERRVEKRLLIMGGGLGLLPKTPAFYEELNAMPGVRTTVITGKNEKLYSMLAGRYENIEAVAYTDRVDLYMKRADAVLTKPGGITLFETIFSGKPILMFAPFLQQEVNNMHFALYHNIGKVLPKKQAEWAREIGRIMMDGQGLLDMTACVGILRKQYRKDGLERILSMRGEDEERRSLGAGKQGRNAVA